MLRLVIQYLDPGTKRLFNSKVWVKIHKGNKDKLGYYGLPVVLNEKVKSLLKEAKYEIYSGNLTRVRLIQVKLILSLLSFFRACSPKYSKVDYESVTSPFTGVSKTLDE